MSEGSMSTVSKEEVLAQDYAGFSEISSFSTVNGGMICGHEEEEVEKELELGLGLSVGNVQVKNHVPREYCRILTAQDFPSLVGVSSSCSSPSVDRNCAAGRKRTAESSVVSQVVGWPPVRTHMMNSLANHTRVSSYNDCEEDSNSKHAIKNSRNCKNKSIQDKNHLRSLFVKVNMDGVPIGRKVDLSAHACYETLAQTLEGMFQTHTNKMIRNYGTDREDGTVVECSKTSKLLDGSSEFVLTYEDKEGDWMLVGDVPWRMFLSSVKRLRIMRTSEAKGLDPGFQDKNVKQKSKPM